MRLFQIVLFIVGIALASMVLSLADEKHGGVVAAVGIASGFLLAALGTWIVLRVRHGRKAPSLRDLIVDTLHRIS